MSGELESLEHILQTYIPAQELKEVWRILYGRECRSLDLPEDAVQAAISGSFELKGYVIEAAPEQLRRQNIVRVGLIQNKIQAHTSLPVLEQEQQILAFQKSEIQSVTGEAS